MPACGDVYMKFSFLNFTRLCSCHQEQNNRWFTDDTNGSVSGSFLTIYEKNLSLLNESKVRIYLQYGKVYEPLVRI